jgi:hypothetical protein
VRSWALPAVAAVAMTAAGVIEIVRPDAQPGSGAGAFAPWAQALGAVAFAAVAAALAVGRALRRRGGSQG